MPAAQINVRALIRSPDLSRTKFGPISETACSSRTSTRRRFNSSFAYDRRPGLNAERLDLHAGIALGELRADLLVKVHVEGRPDDDLALGFGSRIERCFGIVGLGGRAPKNEH